MDSNESRLLLLLSEVSGDVKSLKATLEGYAREVTLLRAQVLKNEQRADRVIKDHEDRLGALERSRSRIMGAVTVISALFGIVVTYISYLLDH